MTSFRLSAAVLGTPDPRGLAAFYRDLLGLTQNTHPIPSILQRGDAFGADSPAGEAVLPRRRLRRGELGDRLAGLVRVALVDPRLEIGWCEVGEREAQVGEVALGIDEQGGYPGREGLFDEHDAETGLARAGHTDDHSMSGEVAAGECGGLVGAGVLSGIDLPADEEVGHGPTP